MHRSPAGRVRRGVCIICLLLALGSIASAATLNKIDDTAFTGDITAIDDANVTIAGKPKAVVVPFADITRIVFKEPAAPVPPPAPPTVADNNPAPDDAPGLLGMLFGSGGSRHQVVAAAAVPKPTSVPALAATSQPTTKPADGPAVLVMLTDGDTIHAKLLRWTNQKITLNLPGGQSADFPSTAVTEMWLGTLELQKKARALVVQPGPEDIAFVAKDADVVIVKGLVQGIAGGSLQFRYGDESRKIGLTKVVGLLLRGNGPMPMVGFHQRLGIDNGDQLSGTLVGLDHNYLVLNTTAGPVKVFLPSVNTIDFVNGRVTSLCDLKPVSVQQTAFFGRVLPYQIDHSLTGAPLVLTDGAVARGIAVHSRCVLSYETTGDIGHFKTRLGFQQPEGLHGRVSARILGDGKVLFENPDARGDQPPIDIDVPIMGVHTLTLSIDFGKEQDSGDRVVWANPRLIRGK